MLGVDITWFKNHIIWPKQLMLLIIIDHHDWNKPEGNREWRHMVIVFGLRLHSYLDYLFQYPPRALIACSDFHSDQHHCYASHSGSFYTINLGSVVRGRGCGVGSDGSGVGGIRRVRAVGLEVNIMMQVGPADGLWNFCKTLPKAQRIHGLTP